MEQDNEKDFLGRQYGPGSSGGGSGQYVPAANTDLPEEQPAGPQQPGPDGVAAHETPENPGSTVHIGTTVWGLVLTVLAVLLLLANTVNLSVDPVLLVLGLTLGAGFALLAGGFLAAARKGRARIR